MEYTEINELEALLPQEYLTLLQNNQPSFVASEYNDLLD